MVIIAVIRLHVLLTQAILSTNGNLKQTHLPHSFSRAELTATTAVRAGKP